MSSSFWHSLPTCIPYASPPLLHRLFVDKTKKKKISIRPVVWLFVALQCECDVHNICASNAHYEESVTRRDVPCLLSLVFYNMFLDFLFCFHWFPAPSSYFYSQLLCHFHCVNVWMDVFQNVKKCQKVVNKCVGFVALLERNAYHRFDGMEKCPNQNVYDQKQEPCETSNRAQY